MKTQYKNPPIVYKIIITFGILMALAGFVSAVYGVCYFLLNLIN